MGERLLWMKISREIGFPVQLTKKLTTSSEMVDWEVFLEEENRNHWAVPSKLDWYLAAILLELRRISQTCPPSKEKRLEKHLLPFDKALEKKNLPKAPETEEEKKAWIAASKRRAFAVTGLNSKGQVKTKQGKKRQFPVKRKPQRGKDGRRRS